MAPNDARLSAPLLLSDSDHNNHGDSSLDSIEDGRKAEKAPTLIYTKDGSVDVHGNASVKDKTGSWKACPFILGCECCERLAYYGISTNLVTYLTKELHEGNATAASNVSNWAGTCYITPLIGAFLADAYWGRYKTIGVFCSTYFVGMALLTIVAAIPWLKPPPCANEAISCSPASTYQLAVFYSALYLIALGTGGIKPCVSSFGADQFDDNDSGERKKKGSFFNWFYFTINIGALISSSVLVYIQDNIGWAWGFGIPTVAMGLAICSFLLGTPLYRHQKPGGSPLVRIVQVCVSSLRKWHVAVPSDPCLLYETESSAIQGSRKIGHTDEFLFLDKAAVETDVTRVSFHHSDPWRLCTVTQVEEVKILIRILPIWATGIMFATVYSQMSTLFVEQGRTMDTSMGPHFNIPPASLSLFDTLSVILWVPLYDRLVVPIARHFTKEVRGFTHLQRMGIGLFVSALSMIAAAIVEIRRLQIAREHDLLYDTSIPVPMSIFWQVAELRTTHNVLLTRFLAIRGRYHCLFRQGFGPLCQVMDYEDQRCLGLFLLELRHRDRLLQDSSSPVDHQHTIHDFFRRDEDENPRTETPSTDTPTPPRRPRLRRLRGVRLDQTIDQSRTRRPRPSGPRSRPCHLHQVRAIIARHRRRVPSFSGLFVLELPIVDTLGSRRTGRQSEYLYLFIFFQFVGLIFVIAL